MRSRKSEGFTLIELIVVVSIIIILSGLSLAAYFRFSQRQAALNDARNFSTMLRRVQAMAKNLVYPTNCTGLSGYEVYTTCALYDKTCQSISARAVCGSGNVVVIDDEVVLEKASFSQAISILFTAGSGSINISADFPITNTSDGFTVVVRMDKNGNISTKEYETYP